MDGTRTTMILAGLWAAVVGVVALAPGAAPAAREAAGAGAVPATIRADVLDRVEPGLWSVHEDGPGTTPRRLCIDDPARLVQLAHASAACSRLVVAADPRTATVHYSCPGAGWGRTALHVDNAASVRIDTQGIAGNAPFAWKADARRIGACPA